MICMRCFVCYKVKVKNFKWTVLCNTTFEVKVTLINEESQLLQKLQSLCTTRTRQMYNNVNSRTWKWKPCARFLMKTIYEEKVQTVEAFTWHWEAAAMKPVPQRICRAFWRAYLMHVDRRSNALLTCLTFKINFRGTSAYACMIRMRNFTPDTLCKLVVEWCMRFT